MTHREERTLSIGALSRVEGEGALYVRARGSVVEQVRLDIYEPPRFFEAFLRGRAYTKPPDSTARICGICPVAYQCGVGSSTVCAPPRPAAVRPVIPSCCRNRRLAARGERPAVPRSRPSRLLRGQPAGLVQQEPVVGEDGGPGGHDGLVHR